MQCNTPVASEVLNVVLAANIAPDRQDDTQLLQAINTLIANGGSGGNGGNGGGFGAEYVGPGAEELAELDIGGAELFQRCRKPLAGATFGAAPEDA